MTSVYFPKYPPTKGDIIVNRPYKKMRGVYTTKLAFLSTYNWIKSPTRRRTKTTWSISSKFLSGQISVCFFFCPNEQLITIEILTLFFDAKFLAGYVVNGREPIKMLLGVAWRISCKCKRNKKACSCRGRSSSFTLETNIYVLKLDVAASGGREFHFGWKLWWHWAPDKSKNEEIILYTIYIL